MSRNRLLVGLLTPMLLASGLMLVQGSPASAEVSHLTIHTRVGSFGEWMPREQPASGAGTLTNAPDPDGTAAAKFTTGGNGAVVTLLGTHYAGLKFRGLVGLRYMTYVDTNAGSSGAVAQLAGMDVWNQAGDFLGTMEFDPSVQPKANGKPPIRPNTMQIWQAAATTARWSFSNDVYSDAGCTTIRIAAGGFQNLEQWKTLDRNAKSFVKVAGGQCVRMNQLHTLTGVRVWAGSSTPDSRWDSFTGYVERVVVRTRTTETKWILSKGIGPCAATENATTKTYTLMRDCSTTQTIDLQDGSNSYNLNGNGHTITAHESGQAFPGPVVLSQGTDTALASASVTHLKITTAGFGNRHSGGQLSGIKFDQSGGSVSHVTVNGISHGNSDQEGIGIWVSNRASGGGLGANKASVTISHVSVTRYQKAGIVIDGNVGFTVSSATVGRSGSPSGHPIQGVGASSLMISGSAHGSVTDSRFAVNDRNPAGTMAGSGVTVANSNTVSLARDVVSGGNADFGIAVSNDGSVPSATTKLTVTCSLVSRSESAHDPSDPYGVGLAVRSGGNAPQVSVSDSRVQGWRHATSTVSGTPPSVGFGPGPHNLSSGHCAPGAVRHLAASGGNGRSDVSWTAPKAPAYAPVVGYRLTATGGGRTVHAAMGATATHHVLKNLKRGVDYRITVTAVGSGGRSPAAVVLHSTKLTMAATPHAVRRGAHVTFSGRLSSSNQHARLLGRHVVIQRRSGHSWRRVATTRSSRRGAYRVSVALGSTGHYRAFYAGHPDLSSISRSVAITVR